MKFLMINNSWAGQIQVDPVLLIFFMQVYIDNLTYRT